MSFLVAAFVGQTALVYLDDTADRTPRLSGEALRGRRIWHQHNCQVCHQIYGFGGFLGPDLTNAAQRLTPQRLQEVLTSGNAQMPAFHLPAADIAAVGAFLHALDQTGVGVPRAAKPPDARTVVAAVAAHAKASEPAPPAAAQRGLERFQQICTACHVPFTATPLGPNTAPDLSTVVDRLDDAAILATLVSGRPERGMPAWNLGEANNADLLAFLHWLHDQRPAIAPRLGGTEREQGLPWWEFK